MELGVWGEVWGDTMTSLEVVQVYEGFYWVSGTFAKLPVKDQDQYDRKTLLKDPKIMVTKQKS